MLHGLSYHGSDSLAARYGSWPSAERASDVAPEPDDGPLRRTDDGWDVVSPNGEVTLARFRGVGCKRRALRYVADRVLA
jgi:hypothetical protein